MADFWVRTRDLYNRKSYSNQACGWAGRHAKLWGRMRNPGRVTHRVHCVGLPALVLKRGWCGAGCSGV